VRRPPLAPVVVAAAILAAAGIRLGAWGPQGHRLVARIAMAHLTPLAQQGVAWLLPDGTLADVASWADEQVADLRQTAPWHYVNLPPNATHYDRTRDCPRQPGAAPGSPADRWRDCVVDRILYSRDRLVDTRLDRADRATALKFLVHLVGDLHQPFHALATARGGNDIPVVVFGNPRCGSGRGASQPCDLHGVWDSELIARRKWNDNRYLQELSKQIVAGRWDRRAVGTPADWAMESLALARAALLPANGHVDEAYYRRQVAVVDERLALGGLRLAAVLNEALTVPPPP
jgi:hypothetical protein